MAPGSLRRVFISISGTVSGNRRRAGWRGSAQLLREQDSSASTASVIEATRLADALAALRARPRPTLDELNEATLAVLCQGDAPLRLIEEQLLIGECLGVVPEHTPMLPLQLGSAAPAEAAASAAGSRAAPAGTGFAPAQ